ncbi:MAG: hypothetical protein ACFCD0_05770 [Gemmataceae bacterium]
METGWGNVRTGVLLLLFSAIMLLILSQISSLPLVAYFLDIDGPRAARLGGGPNRFGPGRNEFLSPDQLFVLASYTLLAIAMLGYTGLILGATAPKGYRVKGPAISSVLCGYAAVLIPGSFFLLVQLTSRGRARVGQVEAQVLGVAVVSICWLLLVLGVVFLSMFLRGIGRTFGNSFLSGGSIAWLILFLLLVMTVSSLAYYAMLNSDKPLFRNMSPEMGRMVGYAAWGYVSLLQLLLILLLLVGLSCISVPKRRPPREEYY